MADQSQHIWFNGKILPWEKAKIHVMSHVLHYGSGVFEGIKCYLTDKGPAIFKLPEHIDRLFLSAIKYKMKIPFTKQELMQGCIDMVHLNKFTECYIRPIAFYGYDTLGVHPKNCPVEVAIASFYWGAYLGEEGLNSGVNITISPWKKLSNDSFPPSAKASGQYMNSLLAVQDAREKGFDEALLINHNGYIAEGSGQNIFIIKDGIIFTNDQQSSILMGITRECIIKICNDLNKKVEITNLTKDMLFSADEAFFTGSASEITPIATVDKKPINNGKPGDITLELKNIYSRIIHGKETNYLDWLTLVDANIPESETLLENQ